jgi:hypothetical protein
MFPAFAVIADTDDDAVKMDHNVFSYHERFLKMARTEHMTDFKESWQGGTPIVMYSDDLSKMAVLSPVSDFKALHMASVDGAIGGGIKGTATSIPAGFTASFLLSSSAAGINEGLFEWGSKLLKFHGKERADMYRDDTHSTIGFWTDNGGTCARRRGGG